MQLRVYANYTEAELSAMDDDKWVGELCHLAAVRQAEKKKRLNDEIKLENLKRGAEVEWED